MLRRTHPRLCTMSGSGLQSDTGSRVIGISPVFRLLGASIAIALGGVTLIIVSWPLLDTFIMPVLFTRALSKGSEQFAHLDSVTNAPHDENNQQLYSLHDRRQVEALRELLFPSVPEGKRRVILQHHEKVSSSTSLDKAKHLVAEEEVSILVLNGPPRSNKAELVQRLAVRNVGGENDNDGGGGAQQKRPILWINARGFVDPATTLHGSLTYLLTTTLGLPGFLVHSYVKILNAGVDMITVNNANQHTSFLFLAMTLGHVRRALMRLKARRLSALAARIEEGGPVLLPDSQAAAPKPLVVIDGFEQFVANHHRPNGDSGEGQRQCQDMFVAELVRAAVDEKVCSVVLITDSNVFAPHRRQESAASSGSSSSSSNDPIHHHLSHYYDSSHDVGRWLATRYHQQQRSCSTADISSVSLVNAELHAAYPSLRGRAKFAYCQQDRLSPSSSSSSSSFYYWHDQGESPSHEIIFRTQAALRRVCAHQNVPPLLVPLVADWVAMSASLNGISDHGSAVEAAGVTEQLDLSDDSAVEAVLGAMEAEGLCYRVAGTALGRYCHRALNNINNSDSVPIGFAPSESLLTLASEADCAAELGSDLTYVDVMVPVQNDCTGGKSIMSSKYSRDAGTVVAPRTLLKRVRLFSSDVANGALILRKLRCCCAGAEEVDGGSNNWPEGGGVVDLLSGQAATTPDQVERDALTWRNGQLLGPSKLVGAAARDCTLSPPDAEEEELPTTRDAGYNRQQQLPGIVSSVASKGALVGLGAVTGAVIWEAVSFLWFPSRR